MASGDRGRADKPTPPPVHLAGMRRCLPVLPFLLFLLLGSAPLRAALHDGAIEADGIWHDHTAEVIPRRPERGAPFVLELQAFRFDLTGATVRLWDGERVQYFPMQWNREAEGGTYDIWSVEIPALASDFAYYHFQLFDGTAYATLARSGFWNGEPPGGDFLLHLHEFGQHELGATVDGDDTVFRVWCPGVERAQLVLDPEHGQPVHVEMEQVEGYWHVRVSGVGHGKSYRFRFLRDGTWHVRNDARARWLRDDLHHSIVLRDDFPWTDDDWVIPDLADCIISEAHVGTFSGRGDGAGGHPAGYRDLVDHHVAHLVESGINVLQLMPVQEFPGELSWGYNPAFLFAPESAYGTPEDFKYLVNKCHEAGIAVWLDVVLNHFDGPNLPGNLGDYNGTDIYFYPPESGYRDTGYGPRPDYGRTEVRDMLVDSMRYLIESCHIDGFRLDHTNLIKVNGEGWRLVKEVDQMRKRVNPRVAMTVEQWPNEEAILRPVRWGGAGMDAQWSDIFHDNCRAALNELAFGDPSMQSIADALNHWGYGSTQMIHFIESHDEARESPPFSFEGRIVRVADQTDPHSSYGLGRGKLFYGLTLFGAGIPLTLYGQEIATEIGFGDGEANRIPWERRAQFPGYFAACRDMAWLRRKSPALRATSNQNVFHLNEGANVLAWERSIDDHVVVVVANFSNTDFPSYWVGLPRDGDWVQLINTNAAGYGGSGQFQNPRNLTATGGPNGGMPHSIEIALPRHSLVILTRHDYDLTPDLDADNDGIEDHWEIAAGLNPNFASDGPEDADGDGIHNRDEFLLGLDPNLPGPAPVPGLVRTGGGMELGFPLIPNRRYTPEFADQLGEWQALWPDSPSFSTRGVPEPGDWTALDPGSDQHSRRFYRMRVEYDR